MLQDERQWTTSLKFSLREKETKLQEVEKELSADQKKNEALQNKLIITASTGNETASGLEALLEKMVSSSN